MNALIAVVGLSALLYTIIQLFMAIVGPARAKRMKRAGAGFVTFLALLIATPSFVDLSEQDASSRMTPVEVAQAGKPAPPPKPTVSQHAALQACEKAAKRAAANPSTVRISRVWDLAFVALPSGVAQLQTTFTAKNAFGLELKYSISCLFEGNKFVDVIITEA